MTVSVSANIHFNEDDVWHRWHPGDGNCHAYGALKFNEAATLFFDKPALIDKVIAELVALKQEMALPPEWVADGAFWTNGNMRVERVEHDSFLPMVGLTGGPVFGGLLEAAQWCTRYAAGHAGPAKADSDEATASVTA